MALAARLSAFAAPLGVLAAGAHAHAAEIPTILKLNSSNAIGTAKDQSVNATPEDALRLGAVAIGTSSGAMLAKCIEEAREPSLRRARCTASSSGLSRRPRPPSRRNRADHRLSAQIAAQLGHT